MADHNHRNAQLAFNMHASVVMPLLESPVTLIEAFDGHRWDSPPKIRFAPDSPLEGTGFEPSVPRQEKWSMPSSSDQTRVGRTLTLGGGAESSLEGRDVELSVSPKDIRTSPYDLCANRSDRRQSREGDRWFESTSLQRRVRNELYGYQAPPRRSGTGLHPRSRAC